MKKELPLVSIVTPSYNKAAFIEETILSVKNQTYPRIEHIVIDGGSTDETLDILQKYSDSITWISEPDEGQSDAINKGWKMAKGDILAYLNADDTCLPQAVETAVRFLNDHPDAGMVYGDCNYINERGETIRPCPGKEFDIKEMLCEGDIIPQPAVFFRRKVLDEVGYLDVKLYTCMDYDFYVRTALKFKLEYIPQLLATCRLYPGTKTISEYHRFGTDYLYTIEKTFSNPKLPREVMALKRRAYGRAHLRIGLIAHSRMQMKQAREHLIKTVILRPQYLKHPSVFFYLVTSFLGRRAAGTAVRWGSKLFGRHQSLSLKYILRHIGIKWLGAILRPMLPVLQKAGKALFWLAAESERNSSHHDLTGDREVEYSWVLSHLGMGPGEVLDFGCGNGLLAFIAARRGYNVTAIDLQSIRWPYVLPSNMCFIEGDILKSSFTKSSFDLIINCSSIEHVGLPNRYSSEDNPEGDITAMALMHKLLQPDGVMLLTIPVGRDAVLAPFHRMYGRQRLPRLLNQWTIEKKEYWVKNDQNRWMVVEESVALEYEPTKSCYGLGCFVLRR